jgi:thioredoxin-related protein
VKLYSILRVWQIWKFGSVRSDEAFVVPNDRYNIMLLIYDSCSERLRQRVNKQRSLHDDLRRSIVIVEDRHVKIDRN